MLLWQWKNGHKKVEVWAHLLVISAVIHGLFLFFFFGAGSSAETIRLLLTLNKKRQVAPVSLKHYASVRNIIKPVVAQKKNAPKIASKSKPSVAAPQKKSETKKINGAKTLPQKTVPAKPVEKKQLVPATPKKDVQEKVKPAPPRERAPEKKEAVKHAEEDTQPVTVDAYQEDARVAQLYALISRHWTPPAGIAHDCVCDITLSIAYDGTVKTVEISKKSGVLMYDIAARKAALSTQFPLWTCGKTITIRFMQ